VISKALFETISYINQNYNGTTVTWGDIHPMYYPNIPFTRTPLRVIFDKEVPVPGNMNTVNVAAFLMSKFPEKGKFVATHSANLKIMSNMNRTVLYSLDTGVSEYIFSGHYFDMNSRHLSNNLYKSKYSRLSIR
jgi:hypothetical protein